MAADKERRRFAAVLDSTADLVCFTDTQGAPLFLNPVGRRIVGLLPGQRPEELTIHEVHPPDSAQRVKEKAMPAAIKPGFWMGETEFIDRD